MLKKKQAKKLAEEKAAKTKKLAEDIFDESSEMSESEKIGLEVDTNIDSIREKIILKIVKNIFNIDNNTKALLTSNLNKFMKQNLTRENIFDINEDDYTEIQSKYYIIDKDNINTNIIKIFKYLVKLIKNKYNVNKYTIPKNIW